MTELRLVVPAGGGGRADRFAADLSGLSRSRVQRLITEGRVTADGQPGQGEHAGPAGRRARHRRAAGRARRDRAGGDPARRGLRGRRRARRRQAGRARRPPEPRATGRGRWSTRSSPATPPTAGSPASSGRASSTGSTGTRPGLLMVAKTDAAQASLMAQLKARRVKKTYLALVLGSVQAAVGRIEAPIGRDPKNRMRMAVVPDGRPSVTGYRVRERFAAWTLLEVDLVTGRTHQIRVHLAALGHPVAGDPVYGTGTARRGPDGLERLFLHAWRLVFASPATGDLVRLEAPAPGRPRGRPRGAARRRRRARRRGRSPPDDGRGRADDASSRWAPRRLPTTRWPAPRAPGRPGRCSSSSRARPGSARTRSSRRSGRARRTPTTTTS